MFSVLSVWVIVVIAALVIWPTFLTSGYTERRVLDGIGMTRREWYEDGMRKVAPIFRIPSVVFPIVWTVLYVLIIAAMGNYVGYSTLTAEMEATLYYTAIVVLFFANITFNHMWSIIFFEYKQLKVALWVGAIIFGSAAAITALLFVEQATTAAWLFLPYCIWTLYAAMLNAHWITINMNFF